MHFCFINQPKKNGTIFARVSWVAVMELSSRGSLELRFLSFTLLWDCFQYLYRPLSLGCQKSNGHQECIERVEILKSLKRIKLTILMLLVALLDFPLCKLKLCVWVQSFEFLIPIRTKTIAIRTNIISHIKAFLIYTLTSCWSPASFRFCSAATSGFLWIVGTICSLLCFSCLLGSSKSVAECFIGLTSASSLLIFWSLLYLSTTLASFVSVGLFLMLLCNFLSCLDSTLWRGSENMYTKGIHHYDFQHMERVSSS